MSANLDNSAVATELEKFSFHPKPKEGQCQKMFKLPPNCIHLHARLRQYVNQELPDVQAGFRKGRGTRDQIADTPTSYHRKSKRIPEKHPLLVH